MVGTPALHPRTRFVHDQHMHLVGNFVKSFETLRKCEHVDFAQFLEVAAVSRLSPASLAGINVLALAHNFPYFFFLSLHFSGSCWAMQAREAVQLSLVGWMPAEMKLGERAFTLFELCLEQLML